MQTVQMVRVNSKTPADVADVPVAEVEDYRERGWVLPSEVEGAPSESEKSEGEKSEGEKSEKKPKRGKRSDEGTEGQEPQGSQE